MKAREEFNVVLLISNGHYHVSEGPQINFPIGPARLAGKLKKSGYRINILDTQAEGLYQLAVRLNTRRYADFVGQQPELMLHELDGFHCVEVGLTDEQLIERLKDIGPDVIMATLNFSAQAGYLRRQISRIKSEFSIPVLIGGVAAAMYPEALGDFRSLIYLGKFDDYIVGLVDAIRDGAGHEEYSKYKSTHAPLMHSDGFIDVEPMDPGLFPQYRIPTALYEEAHQIFMRRIENDGIECFQRDHPFIVVDNNQLFLEGPIYAILIFKRIASDIADGLIVDVMTKEGCVFKCAGCHCALDAKNNVMPGLLTRRVDHVASELKHLKAKGYTQTDIC